MSDPAPIEALRAALAHGRARGLPFDLAWTRAKRLALADLNGRTAKGWRDALAATRPAWEDAYEQRPSKLAGLVA